MKVRASVKPICEKCKVIRVKVLSEHSENLAVSNGKGKE